MPTSVEWVKDDPTHMVAAYTNADCVIYDIETGNPVIKLDTAQVRLLDYLQLISKLYRDSFKGWKWSRPYYQSSVPSHTPAHDHRTRRSAHTFLRQQYWQTNSCYGGTFGCSHIPCYRYKRPLSDIRKWVFFNKRCTKIDDDNLLIFQAMIVVSDYGTWRQRHVFRKLPLIGKSLMKAYSTWPSTPQDLI